MPRYDQLLYERLESSSGAPTAADRDTAQEGLDKCLDGGFVNRLHRAFCATSPPTCEPSVGGAVSAHSTALTGAFRPLTQGLLARGYASFQAGAHGSLRDYETGCCTGVPNLRSLGSSPC